MHSYTIYIYICTYIYIHIQMQIYSHQLPMLHTSTHQEIWIQTLARFYLHQNLVTSQPQVVLISRLKKNVENPVIPPLMLLNPLKLKPWFQTGLTMFHGSIAISRCSRSSSRCSLPRSRQRSNSWMSSISSDIWGFPKMLGVPPNHPKFNHLSEY